MNRFVGGSFVEPSARRKPRRRTRARPRQGRPTSPCRPPSTTRRRRPGSSRPLAASAAPRRTSNESIPVSTDAGLRIFAHRTAMVASAVPPESTACARGAPDNGDGESPRLRILESDRVIVVAMRTTGRSGAGPRSCGAADGSLSAGQAARALTLRPEERMRPQIRVGTARDPVAQNCGPGQNCDLVVRERRPSSPAGRQPTVGMSARLARTLRPATAGTACIASRPRGPLQEILQHRRRLRDRRALPQRQRRRRVRRARDLAGPPLLPPELRSRAKRGCAAAPGDTATNRRDIVVA